MTAFRAETMKTFDKYDARFEELTSLARQYAKAKAVKEHLEEFKKSKIAILMKKYEPFHKTTAAQEREARADPEYLELLEGLRSATEEAEAKRWELELFKMKFEAWRTHESTKRAEMKLV